MARRDKKRTVHEELAYWRSMALEAKFSVEDYERRIGEVDQEIQKLLARRKQLIHDKEVAPEIAARAEERIAHFSKLALQAQLVGSSPRTTSAKAIERKRERVSRKVARVEKIKAALQSLRDSGVDVEKILRGGGA